MFIFFVFVNNVLLLKVVKYGSAAFMYAANAVTLPLVNVLGTSPMVMGPGQAAPLNPFTIVGMGFMLVGLAMWAFGVRQQERQDEQFASGRAYMAGQPRVAFGVPLLPAPTTTASGTAATLARDPMTVRKQLYSKLGVSSPGPGRVVAYVFVASVRCLLCLTPRNDLWLPGERHCCRRCRQLAPAHALAPTTLTAFGRWTTSEWVPSRTTGRTTRSPAARR